MMRYSIIIILLIAFLPIQVTAEIVVIANPSSEITELTRRQVVDIYMGRSVIAPNGERLAPYDITVDTAVRETFYRQLIGKTLASVNAYWASLLFGGRASPPRPVADNAAMLETIEGNPSAIGYVDALDVSEQVNIVFRVPVDE